MGYTAALMPITISQPLTKSTMRNILFTFLFTSGLVVSAQDLKTDLANEINSLRKKTTNAINVQALLKHNNKALLDSLKPFENDSLLNIRFNVQYLEFQIAQNNLKDSILKQEVVNRILKGIKDQDILIQQNAYKRLFSFSCSDFNKTAIDSINSFIETNELTKNLILLIGVANVQKQKKNLQSAVNFNPLNSLSDFGTINWSKQLALARMGQEESIKYCIRNVENYKDSIVKVTLLFNDIGYIRREAAVL
jgi:hypothetical protein